MRKKRAEKYVDGVAKFYKKKDIEKNVKSLDDLIYSGLLFYEEKSKRQEDVEFAEQQGGQLTLKIATQDDGNMESDRNVIIENIIYSIIHIDRDKKKNQLYFYLEEVRRLER